MFYYFLMINTEIEDLAVDSLAMNHKIVFFNQLRPVLEQNRSSEEIEEIFHQLFCNIKAILKADCGLIHFPDNFCFHIMIIRKK